MQVFNARDNLIDVPTLPQVESNPGSATARRQSSVTTPTRSPASDPPSGNRFDADDSDSLLTRAMQKKRPTDSTETLFQDNPEEDQNDNGYTGSLLSDSLLTDSFRDLGEKEQERRPTFDQVGDDGDGLAADESWAESMLHELEPDRSPPPSPEQGKTRFSLEGEGEADSPAPNRRRNPSNPLQDDFALRADPKPGFGHLKGAPVKLGASVPSSTRSSLASTLLLALLIIVLLVILVAQLGLYHFDRLAREEWIRPIYTVICDTLEPLGCELPRLSDLSQVRSEDLVVRSHPLLADALIIDAVLVNGAGFEQPYPAISLSFSDINNNVVAKRLFTPDEYLAGEVDPKSLMPSRTPIRVSLELKDPGKQAVNYTISFRETPVANASTTP